MSDHNETEDLKERPLGELLKRLSQETSVLVRQEIQLARAELSQKGKSFGAAAGTLGGAAVLGLLGLFALTAFFILALAIVMPAWLAALIVAVVYLVIAGVLALTGRRKMKEGSPPVPQETIQTVKEDVEWVKNRSRSGRT